MEPIQGVELLEEEDAINILEAVFSEMDQRVASRAMVADETAIGDPVEVQAVIGAQLMTMSLSINSVLSRVKMITSKILNFVSSKLQQLLSNLFSLITKVAAKVKEWSITAEASVNPSVSISVTFNP